MKNLPSKRGSRDSLAREHTCQSSCINLPMPSHDNSPRWAPWTFSDLLSRPQVFPDQSPQTSNASACVSICSRLGCFPALNRDRCRDPISPLRGVSEVSHAISDCLQSLYQWVLLGTHCARNYAGIRSLLCLRSTGCRESLEVERIEALESRGSSPQTRLR